MPRNSSNRDMDRYRNESFDREFDRNFDRSNFSNRTSLDQGRVTMGQNDDRYMDRDFDLRGSDYGRNRDYERDFGESSRDYGWDRNFDRSQRDFNSGYGRESNRNMNRDYDRNFGRDFRRESGRDRDRGWFSGDMRQNDFGTRRMSDDNFRSTRWGGDQSFGGRQRGEHYGKGPKGWKRSDERIREEACEALWRDNEIDASDIDVQVKDGTLTLTGSVQSRDIKRAAEECVEHISGVDDVHNELRVKRESGNVSEIRNRGAQDQVGQSRTNLS